MAKSKRDKKESAIIEEPQEQLMRGVDLWAQKTYEDAISYSDVSFDTRSIYFDSFVEDDSIQRLLWIIAKFDEYDNTLPINIFINSDGGNVYSGFKFYDGIRKFKSLVNTIVEGRAMSAATIMSIGATGKRYMTKNSYMMIHQVWTSNAGKVSDLDNNLTHMKDIQKRIEYIYTIHSGVKDSKRWKELMAMDKYLTIDECLKYNFIDGEFNDFNTISC